MCTFLLSSYFFRRFFFFNFDIKHEYVHFLLSTPKIQCAKHIFKDFSLMFIYTQTRTYTLQIMFVYTQISRIRKQYSREKQRTFVFLNIIIKKNILEGETFFHVTHII